MQSIAIVFAVDLNFYGKTVLYVKFSNNGRNFSEKRCIPRSDNQN